MRPESDLQTLVNAMDAARSAEHEARRLLEVYRRRHAEAEARNTMALAALYQALPRDGSHALVGDWAYCRRAIPCGWFRRRAGLERGAVECMPLSGSADRPLKRRR